MGQIKWCIRRFRINATRRFIKHTYHDETSPSQTKLWNCTSVEEYINTIITTAHKLNGIGFNVADEWIGSLLLAGLPEEYKPMIMGLERSDTLITGDAIKTKLLLRKVNLVENIAVHVVSHAMNTVIYLKLVQKTSIKIKIKIQNRIRIQKNLMFFYQFFFYWTS